MTIEMIVGFIAWTVIIGWISYLAGYDKGKLKERSAWWTKVQRSAIEDERTSYGQVVIARKKVRKV